MLINPNPSIYCLTSLLTSSEAWPRILELIKSAFCSVYWSMQNKDKYYLKKYFTAWANGRCNMGWSLNDIWHRCTAMYPLMFIQGNSWWTQMLCAQGGCHGPAGRIRPHQIIFWWDTSLLRQMVYHQNQEMLDTIERTEVLRKLRWHLTTEPFICLRHWGRKRISCHAFRENHHYAGDAFVLIWNSASICGKRVLWESRQPHTLPSKPGQLDVME